MQDLVKKAKQGDREAFAELYDNVSRKLYSTAYYLLGRREDAEDLVMDTIIDAYRSINLLRDDSAFERWILRILINKAKKQRGSYINEPVELDESIRTGEETDKDDSLLLRKAMDELNDTDKKILILGVVDGYRSEEIAGIMHMNTNTVRSRRKRALDKIRSKLIEGGITYE